MTDETPETLGTPETPRESDAPEVTLRHVPGEAGPVDGVHPPLSSRPFSKINWKNVSRLVLLGSGLMMAGYGAFMAKGCNKQKTPEVQMIEFSKYDSLQKSYSGLKEDNKRLSENVQRSSETIAGLELQISSMTANPSVKIQKAYVNSLDGICSQNKQYSVNFANSDRYEDFSVWTEAKDSKRWSISDEDSSIDCLRMSRFSKFLSNTLPKYMWTKEDDKKLRKGELLVEYRNGVFRKYSKNGSDMKYSLDKPYVESMRKYMRGKK